MADDNSNRKVETTRRDLLKNAAGGAAAMSLGAGFATGQEGNQGVNSLHGRDRAEVLRNAVQSDQMRFVRKYASGGFRPTNIFEYAIGDSQGSGVIFTGKNKDIVVKYYSFEADNDIDEKVIASYPVGDGVRIIDAEMEQIVEIDTPRCNEIRERISHDDILQEVDGSVHEGGILLTDISRNEKTYRTVIQQGKKPRQKSEIRGRIGFRIEDTGGEIEITARDLVLQTDGVGTANHKRCVFGYCIDGCSILCGSVAGLSRVGCMSACASTVGGLFISISCGAFCQAIVDAACYPTCKDFAH